MSATRTDLPHDDPDNSGQCIYCGAVLDPDPTDPDYDEAVALAPCPRRPKAPDAPHA